MVKNQKKKANEAIAEKTKSSDFKMAATAAKVEHQNGKGALEATYHKGIGLKKGWRHTESINMDRHYKKAEPNSSRWDFGIGLRHIKGRELAVWVEAHPASSTGEIATMLAKLKWLKEKLASPSFKQFKALTEQAAKTGVSPYQWLCQTGEIHIAPNSKEAKQLALVGLRPPQRALQLP